MSINMEITDFEPEPEDAEHQIGPRHMMITDDMKANFLCGFEKPSIGNAGIIAGPQKEYIGLNSVDYVLETNIDKKEEIINDTNSQELLDKQKSLSYLSVKSVEEGIEWYRKEFPKIPEELYPLMSRWNFGNLNEETKKSVKNNKKKELKIKRKKLKEIQTGLKIEHKPVLIRFD